MGPASPFGRAFTPLRCIRRRGSTHASVGSAGQAVAQQRSECVLGTYHCNGPPERMVRVRSCILMALGLTIASTIERAFSCSLRPTTVIHRRLKPELFCDLDHPIFVSERVSSFWCQLATSRFLLVLHPFEVGILADVRHRGDHFSK